MNIILCFTQVYTLVITKVLPNRKFFQDIHKRKVYVSHGSHAIVSFGKTSRKLTDGPNKLKYLPFVSYSLTAFFNFVFTLNSHLNC